MGLKDLIQKLSRFRVKEKKVRYNLKRLSKIEPERFGSVFSARHSIIHIQVVFENIGDFINKLTYATDCLRDEVFLDNYWEFNNPPQVVYFQDFLLESGTDYVDAVSEMRRLVNSLREFLIVYEERKHDVDETIVTQRNLRLLERFVGNLDEVISELVIIHSTLGDE